MHWIVVSSLHSCNIFVPYRPVWQLPAPVTGIGCKATVPEHGDVCWRPETGKKIQLSGLSFDVEKMPTLWMWSNEWQIKYDTFWGVSRAGSGPSVWGGVGWVGAFTHHFCIACPWGHSRLWQVSALMRIADNSQIAVIFQMHLWSTPVAVLCIMYLWAGGWHAARYVSVIPNRGFSVSKFLSTLHHLRDQYLS